MRVCLMCGIFVKKSVWDCLFPGSQGLSGQQFQVYEYGCT